MTAFKTVKPLTVPAKQPEGGSFHPQATLPSVRTASDSPAMRAMQKAIDSLDVAIRDEAVDILRNRSGAQALRDIRFYLHRGERALRHLDAARRDLAEATRDDAE